MKNPHRAERSLYVLDKHISDRVDWDAFMEHRDFIANILNQLAYASESTCVKLIHALGGVDSIGVDLHRIAREVINTEKK